MNWGTVSLALRNLLRNRRRSVMTLFAMTIGLVAVLLFGGYVRDINYALQSDFVRLSGHLQVQHRDYFLYGSGNPSAYGIRDYERILGDYGLSDAQVAYMGDDVVDFPVLSRCGFSISTPGAAPWIQSRVCYVTRQPGGDGAVREVIDLLLKAQGKWDEAMSRYVK